MNPGFTLALEIALALLMIRAAVGDARQLLIPNGLVLAVALLAPLAWWTAGMAPWPDCAVRIGVALLLFAGFAVLFHFGLMGGGDVKLAAALALWFAPQETLRFLVWMSLIGAALTLAVVAWHRLRRRGGRPQVPYGVAIALGAFAILTQRFLNQFA